MTLEKQAHDDANHLVAKAKERAFPPRNKRKNSGNSTRTRRPLIGERLEALDDARLAFALQPSQVTARLAGRISRELNRHVEAECYFQTWARLSNSSPPACFSLGQLLIEMGRTDEGLRMIEQALGQDQTALRGSWRWTRVRALPHGTDWERELSTIDLLLDGGYGEYRDRTQLSFCRAFLLDRLERFEEAFAEYKIANDRKPRKQGRNPAKLVNRSMTRAAHSVGIKDDHTARASIPVRPVFIIGMPRSGTTLTERLLIKATGACTVGEVFDIGEWVERQSTLRNTKSELPDHEVARQHLTSLFLITGGDQCVIDKMPTNFLHLDMILRWFPRALVIHCKRDTRAVRWSCFTSNLAWPFCDLDACSKYQEAHERLIEFWRTESSPNWLEVDYSELVADPVSASRQFAAYFQNNGVAIKPNPDANFATRTLNKFSAHGEIHTRSVERWRHYESLATELER